MLPLRPPVYLPKHTATLLCYPYIKNSKCIAGTITRDTAHQSIGMPLRFMASAGTTGKVSKFSSKILQQQGLNLKMKFCFNQQSYKEYFSGNPFSQPLPDYIPIIGCTIYYRGRYNSARPPVNNIINQFPEFFMNDFGIGIFLNHFPGQ